MLNSKGGYNEESWSFLVLLVIVTLSIGGTVSAKQSTDNEIQPRGMCLNCTLVLLTMFAVEWLFAQKRGHINAVHFGRIHVQ